MKIEIVLHGAEELEAFAEFQVKLAAIERKAREIAEQGRLAQIERWERNQELGGSALGAFVRRDNTQ